MPTLKDTIAQMTEKTSEIIATNPGLKNLWWEIDNAPLDEMRELGKINYAEYNKTMRLILNPSKATIVIYSKEVKLKERIVVDEVIENV